MGSSLKILYLTQFFPPEVGAASVRAKEFVENWVVEGHHVTVLTGFPNYLEGRIYDGFKNRILQRRTEDGYTIVRVYTLAAKNSVSRRVANQIVFYFSALFAGLWLGRFDVVIATSPPFLVGLAGWLIARLRGARFVFEVRDLYPENAVALGVIKNPFLIRFLRWIESFYYTRADMVVAVTEGIRRRIQRQGIPPGRIVKVTNGVNTVLFDKRPSSAELCAGRSEGDPFIVLYAGLIGRLQGLESMLSAASLVSGFPSIVFMVVGDGAGKPRLMARMKEYGLKNVIFVSPQPLAYMPDIISGSDVGLVLLNKKLPLNQGALPVKMFEYMACYRPVIVGGAAEAEHLIKEAEAGICIDPEDPSQLADAITVLFTNRALGTRYGDNGRAFVEKHYSRRQISREYIRRLLDLVNGLDGNGSSPEREIPEERP
jgi:glycosyltransferase involved in cell wall biosynthesis